MTNPASDIPLQAYFEARTNIRELEQRQFTTIQFFLGAFAAVMGGSVGLLQYVGDEDRTLVAVAFVFLANVLSVGLYFVWSSLTRMINRAAAFCLDLVQRNFRGKDEDFWETWIRGERNKVPVPYLLESTLLVFLLPLLPCFFLGWYVIGNTHVDALAFSIGITLVGMALIVIQYTWVLGQIRKTWGDAHQVNQS